MEGQSLSRFIRGMIVTSAVGLALLTVSASQSEAGPWRGGYRGYWGRPYVGVGVGVYPGYYGSYGYGYPAYGYSYPAYYGGYSPGYYGGYGYGYPGVSVGLGYGGGWGYGGRYWGGRYGRWGGYGRGRR